MSGQPQLAPGGSYSPDGWGPSRTLRWFALAVLVGAAALLAVTLAWTLLGGAPLGGHDGFPFWPVFPLTFLLLFVVLRFLWWPCCGGFGYWRFRPPRAEELLEARYVRGEITAEQLRQMRRELHS